MSLVQAYRTLSDLVSHAEEGRLKEWRDSKEQLYKTLDSYFSPKRINFWPYEDTIQLSIAVCNSRNDNDKFPDAVRRMKEQFSKVPKPE